MGILTKWSEHELFQELLFRRRVERSALPKDSPWFDPFYHSPELGKVYFFAILSWPRLEVFPEWKVGLLRWGKIISPELGWCVGWTDLDGRDAFPNLNGIEIVDAFPRVLLALDGSFGDIHDPDGRTDQIFRCCAAKKSLDDWVLQLNPPVG